MVHVGLEGNYVGAMYSDDGNTSEASISGRVGSLPSHVVWNLSSSIALNSNWQLFGSVKNLFDTTYIASRRPKGIFPGPFRQFNVGIKVIL